MKQVGKQHLIQTIIGKAWEDNKFKTELLSNPKEAIESLTQQEIHLPEGKQIQAVDQTNPDIIYINIPAEPNMENMELNEEQLEAVAGGTPPVDLSALLDAINILSGKDGYE